MDRYPARHRVSLDGTWRAEVIARTQLNADGSITTDLNDLPSCAELPVPGNWHRDALGNFHGRVGVERELPSRSGPNWYLCFEGADYFVDVLIDGVRRGGHQGAFTGFDLPLPDAARTVRVVVDAPSENPDELMPFRKRQIKGIWTQWDPMELFCESSGGLWGSVWLEQRPAVHLAGVRTSTYLVPRTRVDNGSYVEAEGQDARVLVDVEVTAAAAGSVELSAQLCGVRTARRVEAPVGRSSHRLVLTVAEPELWWPYDRGEPVLHELAVSADEDELRRPVGLREVRFDEQTGAWTCNGEDVRIRGGNVVPEKFLARYTPERAAADIALIKDANLNAVRVCVHGARDCFYDAADAAGILIWQDMPLQWDYQIADEVIRDAADQCEALVRRLHDHPSIALWSAHNEPFAADRKNFGEALLRAVRSVDGTRPLHTHSDFSEHAYPGWFSGHIREYIAPTAKPYVSEFGALALPSVAECEALGARGWPPSGPGWSYVITEQMASFDIAQIPLGDSLAELVDNTQRYQAQVAQLGIETFRSRGMNYFHFALLDGWPAATWSVVSYARVPKLGYAAVQRASQPILVGASLSREILSDAPDSYRIPLVNSVFVANDTREALPGARWVARMGGVELQSGTLDVPADGVGHWTDGWQKWPSWTPPELAAGDYELELTLYDAVGHVRSTNGYPIRVVHRGLGVPMPS